MSAVATSICDGHGVKRVVRQMLATALTVREARADDAALLFGWRNDERTRRHSLDPRPLDPIGHVDWFMKVLRDDNRNLLLISRAGHEVACVRFDCVAERATVSIYIDPDTHGQGIGGPALTAAIDWLSETRPKIQTIEADVLSGNEASGALFTAAGFAPALSRYELKLAGAQTSLVRIQSKQAQM
jgi:RimJ/RimL family protein N-acetyltransferase